MTKLLSTLDAALEAVTEKAERLERVLWPMLAEQEKEQQWHGPDCTTENPCCEDKGPA